MTLVAHHPIVVDVEAQEREWADLHSELASCQEQLRHVESMLRATEHVLAAEREAAQRQYSPNRIAQLEKALTLSINNTHEARLLARKFYKMVQGEWWKATYPQGNFSDNAMHPISDYRAKK